MAITKHTGDTSATSPIEPAGCTVADERQLRVIICPGGWDCWEFAGTRAQLEFENVIPPGTSWPEGDVDRRFDVGRYRYWLRRIRPEGLKGPKKAWTSGDWWCLRCDIIGGPDVFARRILNMRRALADELYRRSPTGQRELNAHFSRYLKACEDKAFQAFKSLGVPERKKPGRKPKVTGAA